MYLVKTPWLLKKLYPALTWNKSRKNQCIYLTFDDGPIPIVTPFDINLEPEACLQNALKHTENGSIFVFHDSLKAFDRLEYVLPRAMEEWSKQGYEFDGL